jgi:hypothetical protein
MAKGKPADIPNPQQLRHWEQVCLYLDSQPYRAVQHPFSASPPMSVKLFKRMAQCKLVRHYDTDCSYRMSLQWRDILRRRYYHLPEDEQEDMLAEGKSAPFVVDHNFDTLYVSRLAPPEAEDEDIHPNPFRKLPPWLAEQCDDLKELAQAADAFAETPWTAFGKSLMMWKSGIGASNGKGVSWSFLLRNAFVMVRLRRTPFNLLLGSVRFSAETLWTFGVIPALDECKRALGDMWGDGEAFAALTWQTSQVHLCADVANFSLQAADLDRVVTWSRKRSWYVPSVDDENTPLPHHEDDDLDDFL